jgi:hypothetical protein
MLKYFALIYPLGASVLKHLIILECPTSGHLTQFFIFLSNPHPLPAPLPPPGLILIGALDVYDVEYRRHKHDQLRYL